MRLKGTIDAENRSLIQRHLTNEHVGHLYRRRHICGWLRGYCSRVIGAIYPHPVLGFLPRFEQCRTQSLNFYATIVEPVGAPYAVEAPAKMFQNILTQTVPLPGPQSTVIGRAITLNRKDIGARPVRMADAEIDPEPSRSNLRVSQKAVPPDHIGNVLLKGRVCVQAGRRHFFRAAILGKLEKALKDAWTFPSRAAQIHITRIKRREHFAANPGAREQHIEPPFATFAIDRPKRHAGEPPAGHDWTISNADEDNVAFIALHIFDILDKRVFGLPFA